MKTRLQLLLVLLILLFVQSGLCAEMKPISSSRANAVRVKVPSLDSAGTAFFLDGEHVITAFHVVGKVNIDKSKTPPEGQITTGTDISVVLGTGEEIPAQVVAPRLTQTSFKLTDVLPESLSVPIIKDFAILKLRQKPKSSIIPIPCFEGSPFLRLDLRLSLVGILLSRLPCLLTRG